MTGTWKRLGLGSLQGKFLWATVLVVALVMVALIAVVDHRQRSAIIDEVQRRGEVLARNLAASSASSLLLYNFTALEQNVARVAQEEDVVYAIVLDADGRVAAHSHETAQVGLMLPGPAAARAASAGTPLLQEIRGPRRQAVYDFTVPVHVNDRKWGTVRVGVSKQRMEAEIRTTRAELGVLTLVTMLLGGVAAALVARRISRPVRQLAAGATAIARGELNQRIEPLSGDEIGQLAVAFNHMAAQLFQERAALEQVNGELRRRFEELADLKSYTDNILRSLTNGIVTVDLEGRVVTLNPAAELITGFFAGEAVGRYCTELFSHTAEVADLLMETLGTHTPIAGVPLTLRRRNGTSLPVEFGTAPLRAGEGKDLGVVGILRDVSVLRDLESQLRRSDRMAAVGTLAAGLAHEIKNPLTSVLTFSRHLHRRFDDESFRDKFQRVVPRELERINGIVERLLELTRPARLDFQPVQAASLLERVADLYANEIEAKQLRVVRDYARDVPRIEADPDSLYRALVNLVGNALDATSVGGRLTLRCAGASGDRMSPRRVRMVAIEVEDDGVGIPAKDLERVFNPFFTTKDTGTGLGLALTHKIVEDHGGTIDVKSVPGHGTAFRIVLPVNATRSRTFPEPDE
jgi:PAS domain S-box-containing protein